jgi:hypothetical protein
MNMFKRRSFIKASLKYSVIPFCVDPSSLILSLPTHLQNKKSVSTSKSHRFVLWADSPMYGTPLGYHKENFEALVAQVARLTTALDFIIFTGDHVWGYNAKTVEALKAQWRAWFESYKPLANLPTYHTTGNHTVHSEMSSQVFREMCPVLQNGPVAEKGLAYYVRRGNLLLIFAHVGKRLSTSNNDNTVDCEWVDKVLTEHKDATNKLVCGHYPAFSVGQRLDSEYDRIWTAYAKSFWNVLVKHKVIAYLCAHKTFFDVQVHDGVLQLCSAGAGFPMQEPVEYNHFTDIILNEKGLKWRTIDKKGSVREWLSWPLKLPDLSGWTKIDAKATNLPKPDEIKSASTSTAQLIGFHLQGDDLRKTDELQTLLCGWKTFDGNGHFRIAVDNGKLLVSIGNLANQWYGPPVETGSFNFQLVIHTGMGPGGVLFRASPTASWQSFTTETVTGMEHMNFPERWVLGCDRQGINWPDMEPVVISREHAFLGSNLQISYTVIDLKMDF